MTAEVVVNTAEVALNTGVVDAMFIFKALGAAFVFALAMRFVYPYRQKIIEWVTGAKEVRMAIVYAVPAIAKYKWYQDWEKFEKIIVSMAKSAEALKDGDDDGKKRLAAVKDLMRRYFGVTHEWTEEQEKAVEDTIAMAVASAGLIGKVEMKKLPFRIGEADADTPSEV